MEDSRAQRQLPTGPARRAHRLQRRRHRADARTDEGHAAHFNAPCGPSIDRLARAPAHTHLVPLHHVEAVALLDDPNEASGNVVALHRKG
jgi:hypothetical protein